MIRIKVRERNSHIWHILEVPSTLYDLAAVENGRGMTATWWARHIEQGETPHYQALKTYIEAKIGCVISNHIEQVSRGLDVGEDWGMGETKPGD